MKRLLPVVLLVAVFAAALAQGKPNIILVVSDDQGYGEFSCHGNPVVRTPHLDRLHDQSVRFTNFHAAPMCTPTRAQLMTGCDAVRTQAVNVSSGRTLLRRGLLTMPELLRRGGYATALFGKWHLAVERAGEYEFELRRWPREAALALTAAAPAATLADGQLGPGRVIPIVQARLRIAGSERVQPAPADAQHITFRLPLPPGSTTMEAAFLDAEGKPLLGAYYVYVRRLPATPRAGETSDVP